MVAGLVGGVAYAAIPDRTSGTITACYPTSGAKKGLVRVIDAQSGAVCPAGTKKLVWNTRGVTFRGAYRGTTAYRVNDLVTSNGSTYIALLDNTGVQVSNATSWALFAAKGATGPVGPAGPKGDAGPTGPGGLSGYQVVTGTPVTAPPGTQTEALSACPGRQVVIGGGESNNGGYNTIYLTDSRPVGTTEWGVYVNNNGSISFSVTAYAICVDLP